MRYLISLLLITNLFAEEIKLNIKVIGADNKAESLPESLSEIKEELSSLPYKNFSLLSENIVALEKEKVKEVTLPDQEVLKLKLIYSNEKKYCIWLDWKDPEGKELLNTRIHLNCSESVVLGAESEDASRILSAKLVK